MARIFMSNRIEQFQEKWNPVLRPKLRQVENRSSRLLKNSNNGTGIVIHSAGSDGVICDAR
ncbi:hypothetical protein, partial [Mesorhizobium xinjiangense]|uniref:hypothetical protein n=1 Tax=Mesorhizobium xinjiangense TaxID=2678685 RepID=UPI001AEDE842